MTGTVKIAVGGRRGGKSVEVIVDAEDYSRLSRYTWRWGGHYAYREEVLEERVPEWGNRRRRRRLYLHHDVIGKPPPGMRTDHINGNVLDNRKSNLRHCTTGQNAQNKRGQSIGAKYIGVHYFKRTGKWTAHIGSRSNAVHLGYFSTAEDAAMAYNKAAKEIYGDLAYINNIA